MTPFTPNTPGVWNHLPAEVYHPAPGLSHSMAKHMDPPARLPVYLAQKREATAAMIMGTLVHSKVLEPDVPLPHIAVKPEGMKFSTTEGKAWRTEHQHLLILTGDEADTLTGCIASIAAHPTCKELFFEGQSEVSIFSPVAGYDVLGKCRVDFVPPAECLADIKTVKDGGASMDEFSKTLYDERYYTQAAWYLDRWNAAHPDDQRQHFVFVAVEKAAPYLVAVYYVDAETLKLGRERNEKDVRAYAEGLKTGLWKGYPEPCKKIAIPQWAQKRLNSKSHEDWLRDLALAS